MNSFYSMKQYLVKNTRNVQFLSRGVPEMYWSSIGRLYGNCAVEPGKLNASVVAEWSLFLVRFSFGNEVY
jgi:hypothetical protein